MSEEANNIKLVQLVEKYPCLYDYKSPEYSRRDITEKSWATIGDEINCTVAGAKEKWKNLRSVYVRKRKPPPSGSGKKQVKPYYLNNFMEFIIPFIITQVTELGNVPLPSPPDCNNIESDIPNDENAEAVADIVTLEADKPQTPVVKNVSAEVSVLKKKKKSTLNEVDKTFVEYYAEKRKRGDCSGISDNPRRKFLECLLPEIDEMPEKTFRLFKRKVFQLIDDLNNNSNESTSQSSVSHSLPSSNPTSLSSTYATSPESIHYSTDLSPYRPSDSSHSLLSNNYNFHSVTLSSNHGDNNIFTPYDI